MSNEDQAWTVNDLCRRVASGATSLPAAASEINEDFNRSSSVLAFSIFGAEYDTASRRWVGPNADVATGYAMIFPLVDRAWIERERAKRTDEAARAQAQWERQMDGAASNQWPDD